jgi:hypothetical protein
MGASRGWLRFHDSSTRQILPSDLPSIVQSVVPVGMLNCNGGTAERRLLSLDRARFDRLHLAPDLLASPPTTHQDTP